MTVGEGRVTLQARGCPVTATAPPRFAWLAREFPFVAIDCMSGRDAETTVAISVWRDPTFDFWAFDRAMDRASETKLLTISVVGPADELPETAIEVLTRCQRLLRRRNAASETSLFEAVLGQHAALHDLALPLVRADYDHALDTWQWLLRLAPEASLAVQIAALFHDVERLISEPKRRIEQHATDYQAYKDSHAAGGAELAAELLRKVEVPDPVLSEVARLIAGHERRSEQPELALLADADALSFFSLNSAGFADYYGPEHTQTKVAYSLRRLSRRARGHLDHIRLRADVRMMIARAA